MSQGEATRRPRTLSRRRDFVVFLSSQTLSALGNSVSYVAIPLLVLHATGSVVQMGLITGLVSAATITTGLLSGAVVDRVDRRRLLMTCDIARALLFGVIPLTWAVAPQVWLLYVIVPVAGVFSMAAQIGYVAVVPSLVGAEQITKANGRLYASYSVAGVAGPAIAGAVSGVFGPAAAIAIDAATFVASAVGLWLIRWDDASTAAPPDPARRSFRSDFAVGFGFLWGHPVLRTLTILLSFLTFLTLGLVDIAVFHVKHDLGQSDGAVGGVLAAGTVGTLIASSFVARVRRSLGFGVSWIGAYALAGVAVAGLGLVTDVVAVGVLIAVFLFCTGTAGICSMSLRQEVTPNELLGRVTSAFWTVHSTLGPIGATVLTALAAGFGVAPLCLTIGIACLTISVVAAFTPIGRFHAEQP
ncbi:MFS transporter [Nocardia terpenica]|uniref:MFS transporter n=1 Tax=Nocardia terpenica TaxID=455432 RepID=A0A6G9YWX3_9NOCA|nr:MFS transporter [Nocardia terpenica]QIS17627.1 MFS transporter [Nocardia terpenica]